MASVEGVRRMAEDEGLPPAEGTGDVTEGTLVSIGPAEEAEAIVEAAVRDLGGIPGGPTPLAFLAVLVRPRSVFRSASPAQWRTGLVIVSGAVLLRAAAFAAFDTAAGSSTPQALTGAVVGLLSPFAFVLVAVSILFVVWTAARAPRKPMVALSTAFLTAAPLAIKALLQTGAMAFTRHALHPVGILGLLAPGAPALLRSLLAPVDLFGLWAVALVLVSAFESARRDMPADGAEGPSD